MSSMKTLKLVAVAGLVSLVAACQTSNQSAGPVAGNQGLGGVFGGNSAGGQAPVAASNAVRLDDAAIHRVAVRFDKVYSANGMLGVQGDIEKCYAAAAKASGAKKRNATLECVALDGTAMQMDAAYQSMMRNKGMRLPDNPYFKNAVFGARMERWLKPYVASLPEGEAFVHDSANRAAARLNRL